MLGRPGETPPDLRLCRNPLTGLVRFTCAGRAAKAVSALGAAMLWPGLCLQPVMAATPVTETYKIYAHIKLLNSKEFICVDRLWTKESQWNPKASNPTSTAYGIPQLLKLKEKDPYKQIDLGIKYIHKRYGTACNAWAFFRAKGYY